MHFLSEKIDGRGCLLSSAKACGHIVCISKRHPRPLTMYAYVIRRHRIVLLRSSQDDDTGFSLSLIRGRALIYAFVALILLAAFIKHRYGLHFSVGVGGVGLALSAWQRCAKCAKSIACVCVVGPPISDLSHHGRLLFHSWRRSLCACVCFIWQLCVEMARRLGGMHGDSFLSFCE